MTRIGAKFNGYMIVLPVNSQFLDLDDEANQYTANIASEKHVLVRVPAWPFAFWPWHKAGGYKGEDLYTLILEQLDDEMVKNVNHVYSFFDKGQEGAESPAIMSHQWKYYILDFSQVKDCGSLSSKVIFDEAGKKDVLDFDVISLPEHITGEDDKHTIVSEQHFQVFKVARIEDDDGEGKKTKRAGAKKSKLASKLAKKKGNGNTSMKGEMED
jgi:hypothetical protein